MATTYSMDTNVVVFMNRELPKDIHSGLWSAIEGLITQQRLVIAREAYEELLVVGDECGPWAKSFAGFICDATPDEVAVVAQIATAHPGWVAEGRNAADPWVIANAKSNGRTVLTQEKLKGPGTADANMRIPNVCQELGLLHVNLNQLARNEGWQF